MTHLNSQRKGINDIIPKKSELDIKLHALFPDLNKFIELEFIRLQKIKKNRKLIMDDFNVLISYLGYNMFEKAFTIIDDNHVKLIKLKNNDRTFWEVLTTRKKVDSYIYYLMMIIVHVKHIRQKC